MEQNTTPTPIDLSKIVRKLFAGRWYFIIVMPVVLVLSYLLLCTIPRYYRCEMCLSPESSERFGADLALLSSAFGLRENYGHDAISPLLYPDVINSQSFALRLLETPVRMTTGEEMNYFDYRIIHHKEAWYIVAIHWIKTLFVPDKPISGMGHGEPIDIRRLTKEQTELLAGVSANVKCTINKRTDAVEIKVEEQDPEVTMMLSDAVLANLTNIITEYRTGKAKADYESYLQMSNEAEQEYLQAQATYAAYADSHYDATFQAVMNEKERLYQAMLQKQNAYNSLQTQVMAARTKIQEATPVFSTIQGAYIPARPAGPRRMILSILMMLLSGLVIGTVLVLRE